MTTPNILIYRNNNLWTALAADLVYHASFQGGGIGKGPAKPGAEVSIQIFGAETSESEIESWIREHSEMLKNAPKVYTDETCLRSLEKTDTRKRHQVGNLNEVIAQASTEFFSETSPSEVYRKIFERLTSAQNIKRVVIVLDAIVDYNPLAVPEFKDPSVREDDQMLVRYAELFKGLMPEGVETTFVRISELELPGEDTLVLVHHHALNGIGRYGKDSGEFWDCPRVMVPYPKGLIDKASSLCDLGGIVEGDFLEVARQLIRHEYVYKN